MNISILESEIMNTIRGKLACCLIKIGYKFIDHWYKSAKDLERGLWGYEWCKKCDGERVYPKSGIWDQPDGWVLCPRCQGHRWEHVAQAIQSYKK